VTLEFTLFTFCPPGPLLREVVNTNSDAINSGVIRVFVIAALMGILVLILSLKMDLQRKKVELDDFKA